MRIISVTPTYSSQFTAPLPATLYVNANVVANLTLFNTSHAQFNLDRIDAPPTYDLLQVTDTVDTVQAAIADFGSGVSYAGTIVTINGQVPTDTAVSLKSSNIIYMWAAPSSNSNVMYWDETLQLIISYVLSGTPSSIQTAINAADENDLVTVTTGITAHAGGGQTDGVALTTYYNNVTVCATANDSVKLLSAAGGIVQVVKNNGVANLAVFPNTSDTIDSGSANASVVIAPGETFVFVGIDSTNWQSNNVLNTNIFSSTTGITAHAGGGQSSAVALTTFYNNVTTCATAGNSVKLLPAATGTMQIVKNNGATNLAVFPYSGGTIDGGSTDASVTLIPGQEVIFNAINTTDWESDLQDINLSSNVFSSTTGITAHSTGGQASAVALTTYYNNITTCAAALDSVKLLTAATGTVQEVKNSGATLLAVYANTSDTINGGSANGYISVPVGFTCRFTAIDATDWKTEMFWSGISQGTVGAATVTESTTGIGSFVTTLTLTNFIVGAPGAAAAAKGIGGKFWSLPAGVQVISAIYMSVGLTAAGTAATPDTGIGSVVASGVISVLGGTTTFEDYWDGAATADISGTPLVGTKVATAGALTGIAINASGSVKDLFLNAAATWAADNSGNLTATGTIAVLWSKMS